MHICTDDHELRCFWTTARDVGSYPSRLMDGTEVFLFNNCHKLDEALKNTTTADVDRCLSINSSGFGQGDGLPSFHTMYASLSPVA